MSGRTAGFSGVWPAWLEDAPAKVRVRSGARPRNRVALLGMLTAVTVLLAMGSPAPVSGQVRDRAHLVAALDSAASAHAARPAVAGISVAVVRGADTLLMKGYGKADLEWSIATPADASASYEIGSVTKQFTATAIMQLVEQGKLDLDENFTKYLPEFDTRGHVVPLRRLLDHTSGIRGYTEMPAFRELAAKKLPRDTLVSLVEQQPFDFEPGTAQIYNNSAYFLLGLIIQKVSGESYEDYIRKHLFEPAGMTSSYYCSESALHERKAHGYDGSPQGLVLKNYLDHTWPFAAGSLCSTARDLVRWNRALHGGRLLKSESYATMTTPHPLVDGTPLSYAMGLGVEDRAGRRMISHGGGINGYLSDARYFPDEDLIIVVLQNSTGPLGPDALGAAFSNLILGPVPPPQPAPITGDLNALLGEYAGPARGTHLHMTVRRDGDQLLFAAGAQQTGARPVHIGNGVWVDAGRRLWFVMAEGKAVELRIAQGGGHYVLRRIR
jgi:CubicO group peptidase (beta-lactamase class C family)